MTASRRRNPPSTSGKKRSVTITAAWIGGAAVVIGALIALIPLMRPDKQIPKLPYVDRYDDPSGLFSIEMPSVFNLDKRDYNADSLYAVFHLDEDRIDFDAPEENYHYMAIYILLYPSTGGTTFDEYFLDDFREFSNNDALSEGMEEFKLLDQFLIGDSTVLNNKRTEKGYIIKKLIVTENSDFVPNIVLYLLYETDAAGSSVVYLVMNEQAYSDFGDDMDKVINSYTWKPFLTPFLVP